MKIPKSPPSIPELLQEAHQAGRLDQVMAFPLLHGSYLHWDELRFRPPPDGLTVREWWLRLKFHRMGPRSEIALLNHNGKPFSFCLPDTIQRKLHLIDRKLGVFATEEEIIGKETRDRYLVTSLIEEGITSSQLEGASTTRTVAKEMIRSGRKPINPSEQMILRNFQAMELISRNKDQDLTPASIVGILELLEPKSRIRMNADKVRVEDRTDFTVLHVPPDAGLIEQSMLQLCEFANCTAETRPFVHPVIRAIILHFWIGFLHPFIDGNGRTARALFYWAMLHQGYWLTEFVSISRVLLRAPVQYARAYLYTETDDGDLTYFIDHHLRVLLRALGEFERYLAAKMKELSDTRALLRKASWKFNHRQLALLTHALKDPDAAYSFQSHMMSHRVVYETARSDLLELAHLGLLDTQKVNRKTWFFPVDDLPARIKKLR